MKGFFDALKRVGQEIWSLVSDDGISDIWKIGGISAFVFAAFLATMTMGMINETFQLMKGGKDIAGRWIGWHCRWSRDWFHHRWNLLDGSES